jgi:F0F1-type ATP synthase delta subunit
MPKIAHAFQRLAAREAARESRTLTVAKESDAKGALVSLRAAVQGLGDDVEVQIDPHLIGGWRYVGDETLLDASYKKQLLDIYQRITN